MERKGFNANYYTPNAKDTIKQNLKEIEGLQTSLRKMSFQ
jgi:hypothetical protein